MSDCIPSKNVVIRPDDKPWYDPELRRFTNYRNRQRKIAMRLKTDISWNKYKKLRNKVKNLKKFAKKIFYKQTESNLENDSANNNMNYWRTLKDLMKNFKSVDAIPALHRNIDGTDEYYFTDQEKTNCLNEYFTSVSNLDDSNTNLPTFDCTVNDFLDKIQMKMNKSKKSLKSLMQKSGRPRFYFT